MEEEENRQAQEEEKLALTSIYTPDFLKPQETGNDQLAFLVRFTIALADDLPPTTVTITIHLPPSYPRTEPPVYEMKEAYGEHEWLTSSHHAMVKQKMQAMYDATAVDGGEHGVFLFEWIEWLKGWLETAWQDSLVRRPDLVWRFQREQERDISVSTTTQDSSQLSGPREATERLSATPHQALTANLPPVYHSKEPLVDRKSVFVAHAAPVTSVEEVEQVRRYLLSNSKVAKATHNILAYRIVQQRASKGKHSIDGEVVLSDCDDDGESAAGARLLHLLDVCKCRNVLVIVSRWYGGVLLGPDRFKHINNVARVLLHEHGFLP